MSGLWNYFSQMARRYRAFRLRRKIFENISQLRVTTVSAYRTQVWFCVLIQWNARMELTSTRTRSAILSTGNTQTDTVTVKNILNLFIAIGIEITVKINTVSNVCSRSFPKKKPRSTYVRLQVVGKPRST